MGEGYFWLMRAEQRKREAFNLASTTYPSLLTLLEKFQCRFPDTGVSVDGIARGIKHT